MWPNPQFSADLVKFTEEILNGKLQFLCLYFTSRYVLRIRSFSGPNEGKWGNTDTFYTIMSD